jgi:predicted nucleotidyltransferase
MSSVMSSVAHIAQHLAALPFAQRILVFGSAARAGAQPKDLDLFIDLRGQPQANLSEYARLLLLSRIYYGMLDPYLVTDKGLLVRDSHAQRWVKARSGRELLASMKRDGRPLADVVAQWHVPSESPVPARLHLQQQAKALGLPATGSTESLERVVRAATSHPRSWTRQDWQAIAPCLSLHQDLRPGSAGRVQSIMHEGLAHGMVDAVSQILSGGWSWCGGSLSGVDTYLFIAGALRYCGPTDPHLARGNKALCHFLPERGTAASELYKAVVATAHTLVDFVEEEPQSEASDEDVSEAPAARSA